MATTAELLDRVRDLVAEPVADYYADAEMLVALNEADDDIFSDVPALPKVKEQELSDETSDYDLPSDWGFTDCVTLDSTKQELMAITAREAHLIDWEDGGEPTHYCDEFFDSENNPNIHIYPTPGTDVDESVNILYYALPAALVSGSANPTWHAKFHFLPCFHAAATLLRKDHRPEAQTPL